MVNGRCSAGRASSQLRSAQPRAPRLLHRAPPVPSTPPTRRGFAAVSLRARRRYKTDSNRARSAYFTPIRDFTLSLCAPALELEQAAPTMPCSASVRWFICVALCEVLGLRVQLHTHHSQRSCASVSRVGDLSMQVDRSKLRKVPGPLYSAVPRTEPRAATGGLILSAQLALAGRRHWPRNPHLSRARRPHLLRQPG